MARGFRTNINMNGNRIGGLPAAGAADEPVTLSQADGKYATMAILASLTSSWVVRTWPNVTPSGWAGGYYDIWLGNGTSADGFFIAGDSLLVEVVIDDGTSVLGQGTLALDSNSPNGRTISWCTGGESSKVYDCVPLVAYTGSGAYGGRRLGIRIKSTSAVTIPSWRVSVRKVGQLGRTFVALYDTATGGKAEGLAPGYISGMVTSAGSAWQLGSNGETSWLRVGRWQGAATLGAWSAITTELEVWQTYHTLSYGHKCTLLAYMQNNNGSTSEPTTKSLQFGQKIGTNWRWVLVKEGADVTLWVKRGGAYEQYMLRVQMSTTPFIAETGIASTVDPSSYGPVWADIS